MYYTQEDGYDDTQEIYLEHYSGGLCKIISIPAISSATSIKRESSSFSDGGMRVDAPM